VDGATKPAPAPTSEAGRDWSGLVP